MSPVAGDNLGDLWPSAGLCAGQYFDHSCPAPPSRAWQVRDRDRSTAAGQSGPREKSGLILSENRKSWDSVKQSVMCCDSCL